MSTMILNAKEYEYTFNGRFNNNKRINDKTNAMKIFYAQETVPTYVKLLNYLIIFFGYKNENGRPKECYMANEDWGDLFNCHRNSVDNGISVLEELGIIKRHTYFNHKSKRNRRKTILVTEKAIEYLTTFEYRADMTLQERKLLKFKMVNLVVEETKEQFNRFKNSIAKHLNFTVFNTYNMTNEEIMDKVQSLKELDTSILGTRRSRTINKIESKVNNGIKVTYAEKYLLLKYYENYIVKPKNVATNTKKTYSKNNFDNNYNNNHYNKKSSYTSKYASKKSDGPDIAPDWMEEYEREQGFIK